MTYEEQLHAAVAEYYADPLGFVLAMYPWPINGEDGPDTWQESVLREIGEAVRERGFTGEGSVLPIREAIASGHSIGKAQPVSLMLHTPDGLKRWGDLRAGDRLFGLDGRPTTIVAVHDRGVLPVYRVTLDDRSETRCCGDHLWTVRGRGERRNHRETWQTLSTDQLLAGGLKRSNGRAKSVRKWQLPATGAVEFARRAPIDIPPYVLGVWLGDGSRNKGGITGIDLEVIDRLRACGETVTSGHGYSWGIAGLKARLRSLGVLSSYSYQKSVPVAYLERSAADRAELLRGLLDTDGECMTTGSIVFGSTSRALTEDVVWLARSLGGKATIQPTAQRPIYRGPDGARLDGRLCWRATLRMPAGFRSFWITRKQDRVTQAVGDRFRTRWIDEIEPDGIEECCCVTVDAQDSLYLTNDFIPTHNSALIAWIADWLMSTRPHCRGTVTANTSEQLEKKTWAAIRTWTAKCLTSHWFEINSQIMYRKGHRASWFCAPQSCAEENSEAFAGQHAKGSTSFYLFDEASAIPDVIWEVAEGGLTDEPLILAVGNPTRSSGKFHEAAFGRQRGRWVTHVIDARTCKLANHRLIEQWAQDYGEDSDFFRVRVMGLPPNASESQFIDNGRVWTSQKNAATSLSSEPLIAGVDVSGGGSAWTVCRFRKGLDGRSWAPIRITGERTVADDRQLVVTQLAEVLMRKGKDKVTAMFVDSAFGSPIVVHLRNRGFTNVFEVNFGAPSPDPHQLNQRAYQWNLMKEWLPKGAIPKDDPRLESDLCGPGFHLNQKNQLVLESKASMIERGLASPDDGDALSLTFAQPVASPDKHADVVYVPETTWG